MPKDFDKIVVKFLLTIEKAPVQNQQQKALEKRL